MKVKIFIVLVLLSILLYSPYFICKEISFEQIQVELDEFNQHMHVSFDSLLLEEKRDQAEWNNLADSIYSVAELNQEKALQIIVSKINNDTSLSCRAISALYALKGDIYFQKRNYEKAVIEYTTGINILQKEYGEISPPNLKFRSINTDGIYPARAGALVRLKKNDSAYIDLSKAVNLTVEYKWNLGNYYEIIGKKDSAIKMYFELYMQDRRLYQYCNDRIIELNNPKTKLLTELIDPNKRRKMFLANNEK